MATNNTFIRITNKDIWEKLDKIEQHLIRLNNSVNKNKEKLGLHSKLIWWLYGIIGSILIFIITQIVK